MRYYIHSTLIFAFLLLLVSCRKDGELEPATPVLNISVNMFTQKSDAAFRVMLNDELVTDSLANRVAAKKMVVKQPESQHLVVRDRQHNSVLIDTLLFISENVSAINLLQLDTTRAPLIVQQGEPLPANRRRLAFYCSDTIMPPAFGIEVYALYYRLDNRQLKAIDTLAHFDRVERNVLTSFALVKDSTADDVSRTILFQPLDIVTGQPFTNLLRPFTPATAVGPILSLVGGPLGTEQTYINNITSRLASGKLVPASARLLSY